VCECVRLAAAAAAATVERIRSYDHTYEILSTEKINNLLSIVEEARTLLVHARDIHGCQLHGDNAKAVVMTRSSFFS
jgi:hypothetical protein